MDPYIDLLKVLLPELLITHFDIVKHEIKQDVLHLNFEEKVAIPQEFSSGLVISHGFHKEITIQDFPIRGKKVYLHIKRRRWLDKKTKAAVQRDWNLVAQGTRMTVEFAAFLKALNHY
ncbi:ISAon1 family transposase N-terminal region protein [Aquimarina intermedia]|uniref:Transposase IS204/IS1001/IS1096/IS1165 family protein n=1 Tax=Aquimarina intermedia TaxID=350814 RepID=A0A5S5CFM3_9FLAO|nr:transposase family protein [Aquimarina intermedia]TYP77312.1 transposase IS204/IS1001/IS1096/IS1165 family protein [Aquimarina intermedia]